MKKVFLLVFIVLLVLTGCARDRVNVFQDGSAEHPYLISSGKDLYAIGRYSGWELDKHYKLANSIDLSLYADGKGWEPIGTPERPFTGVLDGNGYWIGGLKINRPNESYVGLFGYIGSKGRVENLHLGVGTITGGNNMGIIAGYNAGIIKNCEADGDLISTGKYLGAIAGINEGKIVNVQHEGQLTGGNYVGGLVGENKGTIIYGYHNGNINEDSPGNNVTTGGIAAMNTGTIEKSISCGQVRGSYDESSGRPGGVGGIAGYSSSGLIRESLSYCTVYGIDNIGGFIGYSDNDEVYDSFTVNTVHGGASSSRNIGHFIGYVTGSRIERCYTHGSINNADEAVNVGEFLGYIDDRYTDDITDVYYSYVISGSDSFDPYGTGSPGGGVQKLSLSEGLEEASYESFDFVNVWTIDSQYQNYPDLQWHANSDLPHYEAE